jgi:hypothetical protein
MSTSATTRVEIAIRLYWGLLVLLGVFSTYAQISMYYQFHPDHIGPHNIPFLDTQLLASGYLNIPVIVMTLAATAAFWRCPTAYAGIVFCHLFFLLTPLLSLVIRPHRPHAEVVQNWLLIGLMTAVVYLLTTPAVRTYFSLSQEVRVKLYWCTALISFGYAILGFLL